MLCSVINRVLHFVGIRRVYCILKDNLSFKLCVRQCRMLACSPAMALQYLALNGHVDLHYIPLALRSSEMHVFVLFAALAGSLTNEVHASVVHMEVFFRLCKIARSPPYTRKSIS